MNEELPEAKKSKKNLNDLNHSFYSERWTANFKNATNPFDKNYFDTVNNDLDPTLDLNSHNIEL